MKGKYVGKKKTQIEKLQKKEKQHKIEKRKPKKNRAMTMFKITNIPSNLTFINVCPCARQFTLAVQSGLAKFLLSLADVVFWLPDLGGLCNMIHRDLKSSIDDMTLED